MKKFFSVLLVMLAVLGISAFALPAAVETFEPGAGFPADDAELMATYGNLTYSISGGKVTITDCSASVTSVTIPSTIDGYPVTSIGYDAFYNCTSLASIEIPDSVTSIGDGAFYYCTSLTSIEIPDSVTSIGDYAFEDCTSLESVEIGDSVTSIGRSAFEDCTSLESIEIPAGVTSIGGGAFYNCLSLASIEIPAGVTSIGDSAFNGCKSLEKATIYSKDVTFGGSSVFSNYCPNLTIYGYAGSTSETYAKNRNIPFVALEEIEEPDEYTIVFVSYGKDVTVTKIKGEAINDGEIPKIETDESEEFKGWTLTEGSKYVDFTNYDLTSDVVENIFSDLEVNLYPVVVEKNAYTVIFDGEGTVTKYDPDAMLEDSELPEDPEKENYTFKGWSQDPNAEEGEDRDYFLDNPISALVGTWYPIFEEIAVIPTKYSLYFYESFDDLNAEINPVLKVTGMKTSYVVMSSDVPTDEMMEKDGYEFYGWSKKNDVEVRERDYFIGKNISNVAGKWYAVYVKVETFDEYTITFVLPGADAVVTKTEGEKLTKDEIPVLGFVNVYPKPVFYGWSLTEDSKNADFTNDVLVSDTVENLFGATDVVLYPVTYLLGDVNCDGEVDADDAILLLQHSMFPVLYPIEYIGSADLNNDGTTDVNDAILLLQYSMFPDLYPIE